MARQVKIYMEDFCALSRIEIVKAPPPPVPQLRDPVFHVFIQENIFENLVVLRITEPEKNMRSWPHPLQKATIKVGLYIYLNIK